MKHTYQIQKGIQIAITLFLIFCFSLANAQKSKGKLFIIGGGNRSDQLMQQLVDISQFKKRDYIVVLPMSSEEPDSAYIYFKDQFKRLTPNPIIMLNFDKTTVQNTKLNDSLQKAKLIFISGGDQARFMSVVANTPVYSSIHKAFQNGSIISGTSAGAAVMSENMITGNQKLEKEYSGTFETIRYDNLETTPGLGLVTNAIIDQHFLVRSRFNRLISAMVEFPNLTGIGIDESTAIIVDGNNVKVVGESEVVVMKKPIGIQKYPSKKLISLESMQMSMYVAGQQFKLDK
ncbi:MAG TPA: cyanophycinase [Flavobacterium sp.]|nr:cyanophycinase [Flavobacterium sp.]